jgi:uncharacterized lipoprotein
MKNKLFAVVFLCVGLASCAVAPATRQIVNSFPIDKTFDQVWTAVIETLSELNLPIMNMEKASGLITTDFISFQGQTNEDYCDCGKSGALMTEINRRGKFNVFVKRISDNSCEIKINSVFDRALTDSLEKSSQPVTNLCVSTGKLEANIYKLITDKIK